jgi:hypothetical protein
MWWRTANEKSEIVQGGGGGGVGASYAPSSAGALPRAYTWGAMWRTFPIKKSDDAEKGSDNLAKVLRVWDLTAYGIGSTVGAGIFVVTGVVARDKCVAPPPPPYISLNRFYLFHFNSIYRQMKLVRQG